MKSLVVLATIVVAVWSHPDYSESWQEFKTKYNKAYESQDEEVKFGLITGCVH